MGSEHYMYVPDEESARIFNKAAGFAPFSATDNVNKPDHYNTGDIECIDYMKDNMGSLAFEGYLEGCAKKYMHRWRYKGKQLEDLKKASWYLNRLIGEVENWYSEGSVDD